MFSGSFLNVAVFSVARRSAGICCS